ncbi:MAG: hypothetical protein GX640_14935 [Fibrobacter sp.]|nr:hypothetical protein [Fibrobacter sp.]
MPRSLDDKVLVPFTFIDTVIKVKGTNAILVRSDWGFRIIKKIRQE